MKKITLCLTLILALIIPSMVFASEETTYVAAVKGVEYSTLKEAVQKAEEIGEEYVLLINNVVLDKSVEISGEIELDLNGHTITPSSTMTDDSLIIVLHGGTLTVGDGSEEQTGKISANNSTTYVGIKMTKAGGDTTQKATLIIDSGKVEGYNYGISGNGKSDRVNTEIKIEGGEIIGSNGAGIYHPQSGKLTVTDGYIEGATGIEMRAGELIVEGGTIKGTKVPLEVTGNGNGTTTEGAGIAIAQHTTKKDIDVTITGGDILGYSALYQSNPQGNSAEDIAKVSLSVEGGNFETINGGTQAVYSENKTNFITGGTFSSDISSYKDETTNMKQNEDGGFVVVKKYKVNIESTDNGIVALNKTEAFEGDEIEVTATPDEGYIVKTITVEYDEGATEGYDDLFIFDMPGYDVNIMVVFEEIKDVILEAEVPDKVKDKEEAKNIILESLKEYIEGNNYYKNKDLKAKLEIVEIPSRVSGTMPEEMWEGFKGALKDKDATAKMTSKFIETIINIIDSDNDTMGNYFTETLKPITLNIDLPEGLSEVAEGYERVYYIVRCYESDYEMCYDAVKAKLSEDGKTIEFSTDKLGVFNVAYNDVKKVIKDEKNDNTENNTTTNNEEVPQTGDNVVIYTVLAVVAMVGIAVTIRVRKK